MRFGRWLANCFMEVWLNPMLGFDYAHGRAMVYGSGEQPSAWVSYRDAAAFAVDALGDGAARNRMLLAGGPGNLTPLRVVRIFEDVTGRSFTVEHVPQAVLWRNSTRKPTTR